MGSHVCMYILLITEYLYLHINDLTGSVDAFCGIGLEEFEANACGQGNEIDCSAQCCDSWCCDESGACNPL